MTNSGTIQALNGGTLYLRSRNGANVGFSGGTLITDSSSYIQQGFYYADPEQDLLLDNMSINNAGTFTTSQYYSGSTAGSRDNITRLTGGTVFTNTGLTQVLNDASGTSGAETRMDSLFQVGNGAETATFDNQGTLRIQNNSTRADGESAPQQNSQFTVNSGSTFTNNGTIEVFNESTAAGVRTADFISEESVVNEGTVHIRGNANNTGSSFTVNGSSNSYTQSGSGLRTLLERGGTLTAELIDIDTGTLGGVGTITGDLSMGSGTTLLAGETEGSGLGAGELTLEGDLELLSGSQLQFGLGSDSANSGQLTLINDSALNVVGSDVEILLSDLGIGGVGTYRLISLDSGTITGNNFVLNTLPTGWTGNLSGGNGTNYLDFELTAVPEPNTPAMLFLGCLAISSLRRKRSR